MAAYVAKHIANGAPGTGSTAGGRDLLAVFPTLDLAIRWCDRMVQRDVGAEQQIECNEAGAAWVRFGAVEWTQSLPLEERSFRAV
jgi:hypothetical protein